MSSAEPALRFSWLSDEEDATLRAITTRDWSSESLTLSVDQDEQLAADAVALGAVACYGFANLYALAAHPARLMQCYVNQLQSRPDHVGSVTTTREHMAGLFDLSRLPAPLTLARVLELFDALCGLGPFGFRGPAAPHLPHHLTTLEEGVRIVELIAPGYRCQSNGFLARCLKRIGECYLLIADGCLEGPPHYRLQGVQRDLGQVPGIVLLGHPSEERAWRAYRGYAPTSPTILAFQRVAQPRRRPVLRVERHGSLHLADLRPILDSLGFDVELAPTATERQRVRDYDSNRLARSLSFNRSPRSDGGAAVVSPVASSWSARR